MPYRLIEKLKSIRATSHIVEQDPANINGTHAAGTVWKTNPDCAGLFICLE